MNNGISILRGLAAFGIVGCHLLLSPRTGPGWFATNLCDANVGVFAALSGYLMALGKPQSWCEYVRKRAFRILPVYFVWTAVYLCASAGFQWLDGGAVNGRYADLRWWLDVVFWGSAATHLWFLAALFYVQVVMWPILPRVRKSVLIMISLFLVVLPLLVKCWYTTYPVRLLAFVLLGYGLSGLNQVAVERHRVHLVAALAVTVVLHLLPWPFPTAFVKDWIVVVPIVLFFVSVSSILSGRVANAGTFFGVTSMGVYLLHPLFTKVFGVVIRMIFEPPFGLVAVLLDWVASWFFALFVTVVFMRFKRLLWIVK